MVFLIQNTQNRDTKAVHIKLDELIRSAKGARNMMIEVERLTDEELEDMHAEFQKLHDKAQSELDKRKSR
jgi:low affinity Fe/Cu permease